VRELVEGFPRQAVIVEPLLSVRQSATSPARSTMTVGCPNVVTPCCARCSTRPYIHCLSRAGNGRG
jgi:hypothetical protein